MSTDMKAIKNDSIVLNDILCGRLGAERIDLLDAKYHGKLELTFYQGMITSWKMTKKRKVNRD